MQEIQRLLHTLGVGRNYVGFYQTARAIFLILEDETRLESVTKYIFQVIGVECGCSWRAVERNIRTVIQRCWQINPQFLSGMARYPLAGAPTIVEFLDIVSLYLARKGVSVSCAQNHFPVMQ